MSHYYDYYEDDVAVTDGEPSRPGTSQRRYRPVQNPTERATQRITQRQGQGDFAGAENHTRRWRPGVDRSDYTQIIPPHLNPGFDPNYAYEDEYEDEEEVRPRHNPATQRLSRPVQPRQRSTDEYPVVAQQPQQRVRGAHPKQDRRTTGEVRYRDTEPQQVARPGKPARRIVESVPSGAPARRSHPLISRRNLLFGAGTGIGGAVGLLAGISWLQSERTHIVHQLEEGNFANKPLSLVCGHYDSPDHPTQLHAYVQEDGHINFIELPGGDPKKVRFYQTDSLRSAYSGELSNVYLQIIPELVGVKTYQIRLHVEIDPVGFFTQSAQHDWVLPDSGKGYFVAINPKK